MKPRPQAVAAYRSRLRTKPQSGSGILPNPTDVGYNHAHTWHGGPIYARSDSQWTFGAGWAGLAGGGCLPILRWSGEEAQATEDGWSSDFLLPAQDRSWRGMPTTISPLAESDLEEARHGRLGLLSWVGWARPGAVVAGRRPTVTCEVADCTGQQRSPSVNLPCLTCHATIASGRKKGRGWSGAGGMSPWRDAGAKASIVYQ